MKGGEVGMKSKADRKPTKICGDCVHIWACSAQCGGSLQNTDASGCSIYERYSVDNDPVMLRAELKKGQWISVSDRLPRSVINKVLVWLEHDDLNGYIGFGHYEKYKGQEIWFDLEHSEAFEIRGYRVTHWMPLPEPPKEDADERS